MNARLGHEKAIQAGEIILHPHIIEKIWITPQDEKAAWSLFRSRKDKTYSFTDCTSFIAMRRLKITKYLAFDDHFKQEGFEPSLAV